jgi:hypothetical protein
MFEMGVADVKMATKLDLKSLVLRFKAVPRLVFIFI